MPGITGIITKKPSDVARRDLQRMVESMHHETYYSGGQYINEELGLFLGWMGHAGTFPGPMPLIGQNKDIIIVIQGENFIDPDTITKIQGPNGGGEKLGAHYLLKLYEELGDGLFSRLNGWFAGVIADLRNRRVILFNDRYEMGRVYVHEGTDEFLFGAEAKCLLKVRPELRSIEPQALAQFLRCNCVMGDATLFKSVSLLPSASSWTFEGSSRPQKTRYFDFRKWEDQRSLEANEFYQRFTETVSRVFPRYAQSPHQVAMSLTAGLDTRVLMAALGPKEGSLPCYTFGGTWGETYDIRTARKVATACKQTHQVIRISEDFLRRFGEFAQKSIYISDGTHDAFGAHDLYFNQIAREIGLIRLTGKFGSEVVRVRKLIPSMTLPEGMVQEGFRKVLDAAPSPREMCKMKNGISRVVAEEIPWYEYGRVAVEQSQTVLRTPYMDNELVKLMFQAPTGTRTAGNLQAQFVKDKSLPLHVILTNLSRSGDHNRLVKEFLYLSFWSLFKLEYIYLYATPHWLTRIDRSLAGLHLERILSGRQKFEGYRIWMKTHFPNFIRDVLLSPSARVTTFFEKSQIEKMVNGHLDGTHNYLYEINKLLTVELIYSTLIND